MLRKMSYKMLCKVLHKVLCKDASRSDLLKDLALHLETGAKQDF
jgi:hypothetical protein